MDIKISMSDPVPIYIQILEQIKLMIAQKQLKEGDKLPSVRELAIHLNLNPRTVSNAYKELAHLGLIQKKSGIGLFVNETCIEFSEIEKRSQLMKKAGELFRFGNSLGFSDEEVMELMSGFSKGVKDE